MSLKIFVHSLPGSGHVNPMASCIDRLVNEYKAQVYWYTTPTYREIVENSGAIYRELVEKDKDFMRPDFPHDKRTFPVSLFIDTLLRFIEANFQKLAADIEHERPDLILADSMSIHFKWAWKLFEKNVKKLSKSKDSLISTQLPEIVYFETSFAQEKHVFPNKQEQSIMFNYPLSEKIFIPFRLVYAIVKYKFKCFRYGLDYMFPLDDIFLTQPDKYKIVATFPEFQARSHKLSEKTKFIGCCIDERIRSKAVNPSLNTLLAKFPERNPSEEPKIGEKLVYISMGTVFNKNIPIFIKFIQAITSIKNQSSNLYFIVSAGSPDSLKQLEETQNLNVPENVLLVANAPQLEILKRASLFVTHSGMNSVNEAIYYGVPMINVPIAADQPLVAHRVANELGFGVLLDFTKMTPDICRDALERVLNDDSYHERVYRYSMLSRQSNGKIACADFIIEYLKKNDKKTQ